MRLFRRKRDPATYAQLHALLPNSHIEPNYEGELVIYTGLVIDENDPDRERLAYLDDLGVVDVPIRGRIQ